MESDRRNALTTLTYIIRAMLGLPPGQEGRLVGEGAQPWADLLERLTRSMQPDLAPVVVPLLSELSSRSSGMTDAQRQAVGRSARGVLDFAWGQERRIPGMVLTGIEAVCRTYESDPQASGALLRRSLAPAHLASHGYAEMPHLVREIGRVMAIAPDLVEDVYRALLGHEETSDERVPLGHSAILSLVSNRRQDFALALHQLGELLERFTQVAPVHATGAVIAAVEIEAARPRNSHEEIKAEPIRVGNVDSSLAEDLSYIWDCEGRACHDTVHRMLDGFESMLVRLGRDQAGADSLQGVVNRVARENRFAAVWRRVLRAAAATPATLGLSVKSLAWSPAVLTCVATHELAGNFLRAIFPFLSHEEKGRIERTILAIPHGMSDQGKVVAERRRDRLLGCLPENLLSTDEAKERVALLNQAGGAPPNDPPFRIGDFTYEESTSGDALRYQGAEVDQPATRRLLALGEEAARFVLEFSNENPGHEQLRQVLPSLRSLHDDLVGAGADPRVVESAATHLAGACAIVARSDQLLGEPDIADFLRRVFLDSCDRARPIAEPERAPSDDEMTPIIPSPRWYAADGLCRLAWHPGLADDSVLAAIDRLSRDPDPWVRAQIARKISFLHRNAREMGLAIFRRICEEENNQWVIRYALEGVSLFAGNDPGSVRPLVREVFRRVGKETHPANVRQACLHLTLAIDSSQGHYYDNELVDATLDDLAGNQDLASELVFTASGHLLDGPMAPPNPATDEIRLRSIRLLESIAKRLADGFSALNTERKDTGNWSEEAQARARQLRLIADQLGVRLQHAAETLGGDANGLGRHEPSSGETKEYRFLRECSPLFDALLEIPFPSLVHAIIETLQKLIHFAPGPVLLKVAAAVRVGQEQWYHAEQLAIGTVVKILRQYFADYPRLLQQERSYREAIVEILDVFVRAGWPDAMRLTFHLEDIFR